MISLKGFSQTNLKRNFVLTFSFNSFFFFFFFFNRELSYLMGVFGLNLLLLKTENTVAK